MSRENPSKYVYHTDPSHGWLAVKRKELVELGILGKISRYSYQRGQTVYLEEDCDMNLFIITKQGRKDYYSLPLRVSHTDRNSPIRSYQPFALRLNASAEHFEP